MSSGLASAFLPRLRSSSGDSRSGSWWRASTRDYSTGLLNPDAFESVGASVIRSAARRGEPLSALVIGCDAAAGSTAPDPKVFTRTATVVRETFDADEVVGRDGWTFIILLPATDEVGAVASCARIAAAFSTEEQDGVVIADTVAFGTATRPPDADADLKVLLVAARGRLAEERGRREVRL